MQPEIVTALRRLVREGVLTPERAAPLLREARGELVSLHAELRALLYLGVLLVSSGIGLLVKQNLDRIGPVTVAVSLAVAALVCLAWVARVGEPFTWAQRRSPHLAFDYVLLLGILLAGADLAYVEAKFTALGESWPRHLLIAALLTAALAVRYDSRLAWSLALTTFAAWAGINLRHAPDFGGRFVSDPAVLASWLACGVLFVLMAGEQQRRSLKSHFAPVTLHLGWLLVLAALANGTVWDWYDSPWMLWAVSLLAVGGGLAVRAHRSAERILLALGSLGVYVAISAFAVHVVEEVIRDTSGLILMLWFAVSGLAAAGLLFLLQRYSSGDR